MSKDNQKAGKSTFGDSLCIATTAKVDSPQIEGVAQSVLDYQVPTKNAVGKRLEKLTKSEDRHPLFTTEKTLKCPRYYGNDQKCIVEGTDGGASVTYLETRNETDGIPGTREFNDKDLLAERERALSSTLSSAIKNENDRQGIYEDLTMKKSHIQEGEDVAEEGLVEIDLEKISSLDELLDDNSDSSGIEFSNYDDHCHNEIFGSSLAGGDEVASCNENSQLQIKIMDQSAENFYRLLDRLREESHIPGYPILEDEPESLSDHSPVPTPQ